MYETDPLVCPKCSGEMRIISFIDQPDVIKKILEHLGCGKKLTPRRIEVPRKKRSLSTLLNVDDVKYEGGSLNLWGVSTKKAADSLLAIKGGYGSINSPSRGGSRDSQLI